MGLLAIFLAVEKFPLIVDGVTTTGTVVSVDPNVRAKLRYGVVEFRDRSGATRRTVTTSGRQAVGDTVGIIYVPSDSDQAAEHSFATTWGGLIALPLLSAFLITGGRSISRKRPPGDKWRRRR